MRISPEIHTLHVDIPKHDRHYSLYELSDNDLSRGLILSFPTYQLGNPKIVRSQSQELATETGLPVLNIDPRIQLNGHTRLMHTARVAQQVAEAVPNMEAPVHCFGHSMGGSLALLTAYSLGEVGKPVGNVVTSGSPTVFKRWLPGIITDLVREGRKDRIFNGQSQRTDVLRAIGYGARAAFQADPLLLYARCLTRGVDFALMQYLLDNAQEGEEILSELNIHVISAEDDLIAPQTRTKANFIKLVELYDGEIKKSRQFLPGDRTVDTYSSSNVPLNLHCISDTTHALPSQLGDSWIGYVSGLIGSDT